MSFGSGGFLPGEPAARASSSRGRQFGHCERIHGLTGQGRDGPDGFVRAAGWTIPTHTVIWAAGNTASPMLRTLGVPLDNQGRVVVEPDCTVPGHPEVFVIGDAAYFAHDHHGALPGIAVWITSRGYATSGSRSMGSRWNEIAPSNTMPRKSIATATGRWMERRGKRIEN